MSYECERCHRSNCVHVLQYEAREEPAMVKVVSTRGLPPECRSRELYAPILFDRTERLTEEERLAVQAAAKREQRKRKKQQEITEIPEGKRTIRSSLRNARLIQRLKNLRKPNG